jgi:hypothetical protein
MLGIVELLLHWLASLVKSRRRLEAENLVLLSLPKTHPMTKWWSGAESCAPAEGEKRPIPPAANRPQDHQKQDRDRDDDRDR